MGRRRPPPTVRKRRKHNTSRSCNGKTRFRDEKEAKQALHLIQNVNTRSKVPVRTYRCPRCHGVHLTAQSYHPDMD